MHTVMSKNVFIKNEDTLNQYDYVEVKVDNETLGIYVSDKYAEDVKSFIGRLREDKSKIKI